MDMVYSVHVTESFPCTDPESRKQAQNERFGRVFSENWVNKFGHSIVCFLKICVYLHHLYCYMALFPFNSFKASAKLNLVNSSKGPTLTVSLTFIYVCHTHM